VTGELMLPGSGARRIRLRPATERRCGRTGGARAWAAAAERGWHGLGLGLGSGSMGKPQTQPCSTAHRLLRSPLRMQVGAFRHGHGACSSGLDHPVSSVWLEPIKCSPMDPSEFQFQFHHDRFPIHSPSTEKLNIHLWVIQVGLVWSVD
jgi:hypothetical protein